MLSTAASLAIRQVLSKWVVKFDSRTLETNVAKKTFVLRNFHIVPSTLERSLNLPESFQVETAHCNYLKVTFTKWPTTYDAMVSRMTTASFRVLTVKIKWRSPSERRESSKTQNRTSIGSRTEAELQRRRKLLRSLQLEASSLRFQITLPGGAQANFMINGAKLYSTNARWQRIFSLKHMFNLKHYKLIHIESTEFRFGWARDHADRESDALHNMGFHHNCPIEIRMTQEYEFVEKKTEWSHQVPSTLLIEIQGEIQVDTHVDTLYHMILWFSRAKLLLTAAESSGHHLSLMTKDDYDDNDDKQNEKKVQASVDLMIHAWLQRFRGDKFRRWFGLASQSVHVRGRVPIMNCRVKLEDSNVRFMTNDPIMLEFIWENRTMTQTEKEEEEEKDVKERKKKRRGSTKKSQESVVHDLVMTDASINMKTFQISAYVHATKTTEEIVYVSDTTLCVHVRESGQHQKKKMYTPCHHEPFESIDDNTRGELTLPQTRVCMSANSVKIDFAQSPYVVNDVIVPIMSRITSEDMARDAIRGLANLILIGRKPKGGFFQRT